MQRAKSRSNRFALELQSFWHGQVDGKQQPFYLYTASARTALRKEVERAIAEYEDKGDVILADRLGRYWEFISLYIALQNEGDGGKPIHSDFSLSDFLHLLYEGKTPSVFWHTFSRRYRLRALPLASFWDYFDEFQPKRLEVADWLRAHAHGRILDLGSGAHSYIPVDTAADCSKIALAKNRGAKKKVVADLDSSFTHLLPHHPFDTIMLNSILAYTRSPPALLRNCRQLIKDDGVLLITNAPVQPHHPASVFVRREVNARALKRWLNQAGWKVKEDDSTGEFIRLMAMPEA